MAGTTAVLTVAPRVVPSVARWADWRAVHWAEHSTHMPRPDEDPLTRLLQSDIYLPKQLGTTLFSWLTTKCSSTRTAHRTAPWPSARAPVATEPRVTLSAVLHLLCHNTARHILLLVCPLC